MPFHIELPDGFTRGTRADYALAREQGTRVTTIGVWLAGEERAGVFTAGTYRPGKSPEQLAETFTIPGVEIADRSLVPIQGFRCARHAGRAKTGLVVRNYMCPADKEVAQVQLITTPELAPKLEPRMVAALEKSRGLAEHRAESTEGSFILGAVLFVSGLVAYAIDRKRRREKRTKSTRARKPARQRQRP